MALFFTPAPPIRKSQREQIRDEIDDFLLSDEEDLADDIGKMNSIRKPSYNSREKEIVKQFAELKNAKDTDGHQTETRPLHAVGHMSASTAPAPVFDCLHKFDWFVKE